MPAPPFRVKGVYDYASPHDDDLKFSAGQIITVTQEEDEEWYFGEYIDGSGTKQEGIFPRNFVERYEPQTPPRPSRSSRPKKEAALTPAVPSDALGDSVSTKPEQSDPVTAASLPPAIPHPTDTDHQQSQSRRTDIQPNAAPDSATPPKRSEMTTAIGVLGKPAPQIVSQPVPPAATEKPTGGSFRDRIAAFNKPAAPPIAPPKPGGAVPPGTSNFIKKPFIAPPPSRDAYVPSTREIPPQRIYRRDDDPDVGHRTSHETEVLDRFVPMGPAAEAGDEGDEPKPTSLKDRIALLQKQQMEQAARHAEAAQKKEKPKRPPKKRMESQEVLETTSTAEGEPRRWDTGETVGKQSIDTDHGNELPPSRSSTKRSHHREIQMTGSSSANRELLSDANDADQSGAGDTEDAGDFSTERDDSDEKPQSKPSAAPQTGVPDPPHEREVDYGDHDNEEEAGQEGKDEDEEDELDPEVKRRLEIRERMAKMSGGMGMAGMFGPPGAMPMPGLGGTKVQKGSGSSERKVASSQGAQAVDSSSAAGRAPPVPIMPMLGMQKVRSPEEVDRQLEVERDDTTSSLPITQIRPANDVPDIEDLESEPPSPARVPEGETMRSPPMPHGMCT